MKQSILIIVGGALASLLAIPQVAAFFARSARSESNPLRETDEIRQTFKLASGTNVEISSIRGPVEIETSNSDTAEILITRTADNSADLQKDKITVDNKPGTLIIRGERTPGAENPHVNHHATLKLPSNINLAASSISGALQITGGLNGPLVVSSISGSVKAGAVDGTVQLASVSGSVTFDRVAQKATFKSISGDLKIAQVAGPLDVFGVTGSVTLDQVAEGAFIKSITGNLTIDQANDSLEIASVSGTVSAGIAKLGTGGVQISSVSRQVELRFKNAPSAAQITAKSVARGVAIDLPNVTVDEKTPSTTLARIGNGGPPITISSVSGGVRLMLDTQTRSQE